MRVDHRRVERLVIRIQECFLNVPSLRMTLSDVQRRFRLDRDTSQAILGVLVDAGVLARASNGAYMRLFPRVARAA